MRKGKKGSKNKSLLLYVVLPVLIVGTLSSLALYFENPVIKKVQSKRTKVTIYPKLYSDSHITENAKITDKRFKQIVISNKKSNLANTINSIPKDTKVSTSSERENGTWLWTPIEYLTSAYTKTIISDAKKSGIKNIYLSIDSYLDIFSLPNGEEKDKKRKEFGDTIERFIRTARINGITVDAEAGWRNWAEKSNLYKPYAVLNYAQEYNRTRTEKFRGFQFDVEPYLLEEYQTDRGEVLYNLVDMVNQTVSLLEDSDLRLSVVIPEFYDGANDETPKFNYEGKTTYTVDHLLRVLDQRPGSSIIVMSYRNFSLGNDGSVEISQNEIDAGNNHRTKIIIAQETGDFQPPYITFYNTNHKYYKKQVGIINEKFSKEKSFGGIATHYVNAMLELK
ncbi:MAG: hypothetical protein ABL917_01650 [Parcubacteria group bacterium]